MRKCLCIGLGAMLAFSSCTTIKHTSTVAEIDTRIYNLTVAELDVKKDKAEATANWNWTPFSTFNLKEAKDNVTAEVLKASGGDVLVEPQFEVKRRGFLRGGSITVTGYPATYKNFHNMTPDEAKVINSSVTIVAPEMYSGLGVAAMNKKAKASADIFKPKKKNNGSHRFINVLGGISVDVDGNFDPGFNLNLMYGSTGQHLGYYVKASLFELQDYEDYEEMHYGFTLTGGIVKPFNDRFSLFAGLGVGTRPTEYYDWSYYDYENKFTIPVEVGAQYSFGKFNVAIGCSYTIPVDGGDSSCISPFWGVGYCF